MSFAHAGLATQTGLVPNAVYAATIWGTSTPAGIYADADRDATLSSSVATDAAGNAAFYSDPGTVALRIIGGVGNEPAVPVTIPVNPLDIGGSAALSLSYNSVGPFSVPVFNVPSGWNPDTSVGSLLAQLTTGAELIAGLEDPTGDALPDAWTFPALIFVIEGTIYDITSLSALQAVNGGLMCWAESGGMPNLALSPAGLFAPNMPTSDPGIVGALWSNDGVVTVSAG